jgi:hypothetical protein
MCPGKLYFFEGERRIYMIRNTAHFILFAPHQGAERRSLRTLVQNPMNYGKVRTAAIHAQFSQRLQSIRHSDILTTSRYIDVNSKKLSEAAQRFKHWPLHITA